MQYNIKYGIEEMEKPIVERDPAKNEEICAVRNNGLRVLAIYLPNELIGGESQGSGDDKLFLDLEYTNAM